MNDTRPSAPPPHEPERPATQPLPAHGTPGAFPPPGEQYGTWGQQPPPQFPSQLPPQQGGWGQVPPGGYGGYGAWPPAPQPRPRKGRAALAAVAGGVIGAALTCAIAIPIVHNANQDTRPASSSSDGADIDDLVNRGGGSTDGAAEQGEVSDAGVLLVNTQVQGGEGAGTAMVLTSDGLAVTNYHVVDNSTTVEVEVAATGETHEATVLGYDASADVAVLQIDGVSDLDTVTLDDDGGVDVGDAVAALGNAGGQGFLSEVRGEVTSLDESITTTDQYNGNETEISGLIETDADVVPGYSGGPMFDAEGEVIGISTAAASTNGQQGPTSSVPTRTQEGGGISYARPIDEALDIVQAVIDGDEGDGIVIGTPAYLGVSIDPSGGEPLVAAAEADTPAGQAGLEEGDVITGIGDTEVATFDELAAAVASYEPGDTVTITWDRDGREMSGEATLTESPLN
ncbi:MAG TPA: trypsin-like peptidase domain-containing protein [Nocardioides sp.]